MEEYIETFKEAFGILVIIIKLIPIEIYGVFFAFACLVAAFWALITPKKKKDTGKKIKVDYNEKTLKQEKEIMSEKKLKDMFIEFKKEIDKQAMEIEEMKKNRIEPSVGDTDKIELPEDPFLKGFNLKPKKVDNEIEDIIIKDFQITPDHKIDEIRIENEAVYFKFNKKEMKEQLKNIKEMSIEDLLSLLSVIED